MAKKKTPKNAHAVYHGKEPSWTDVELTEDNYQSELSSGLNYYSTVPLKDRRKHFVKWAKETIGKTTKDLSGIPTDYLFTISSQARMVERGFEFSVDDTRRMINKLESLIKEYKTVEKPADESQEKLKQIYKDQAVEALIGNVMDVYDNLIDEQLRVTRQLKAPTVDCSKLNVGQLKSVVDYYEKQLLELKLVYNKADKELMEGYLGVPRVQISRLMKLHVNVLDELQKQQLLYQAKKPRKTRSKKVKTAQELTKKLNCLTSHEEYGIMSISPEKLIGCSVAWIFNTKNRKLQYYYSDSGITVKGSTLQNFSKGGSTQKTIRKPKEFLDDLMKQPRVRSEKLYESVNSKASTLTGRINAHCIILKVY